ncbi:MAG: protease inhibitor I42 family protein [Clostridia bacterium]|nr:protease inhibitor I42 family protein [Clostridia bacterium]
MSKIVSLTQEECGKHFEIKVGDFLIISLLENPSTGYFWKEDERNRRTSGKEYLKLVADSFIPPANPLPGAGGVRIFAYQAVLEGEAGLKFILQGPGGQKADTVKYYFTIGH